MKRILPKQVPMKRNMCTTVLRMRSFERTVPEVVEIKANTKRVGKVDGHVLKMGNRKFNSARSGYDKNEISIYYIIKRQ